MFPTAAHMAFQQAVPPFHWHYDEFDDKNFELHGHSFLLLLLLLAAVLLFTFLCLYARWFFRRRRQRAAAARFSAAGSPAARGLDPDAIGRFPVHLHRGSAADEAQCSICLGNLVEGDKVKVLPGCGHWFHPECVDKWLTARPSCPLCRAPLGVSPEPPPSPAAAAAV